MTELLKGLNEETVLALCGMLLGLIAIIGGIIVAVTVVVSAHRRRSQLDEMEATLKMEMIQRGMSADEISHVLGAKMGANKSPIEGLFEKLPNWRAPHRARAKPLES